MEENTTYFFSQYKVSAHLWLSRDKYVYIKTVCGGKGDTVGAVRVTECHTTDSGTHEIYQRSFFLSRVRISTAVELSSPYKKSCSTATLHAV